MEIDLKLHHQSNSGHQLVCGLLLPAAEMTRWIDAVCSHRQPLSGIRLVQLRAVQPDFQPDSEPVSDGRLTGDVLMLWSDSSRAQEFRSRIAANGQLGGGCWYRAVAERLLLPVDADLSLPLSLSETRAWLADYPGYMLIWHPRNGLLICTQESLQTIPVLVRTRSFRSSGWSDVRTGQQLNSRIQWIRPRREADVSSLLDDGREDIGSQGGKLDHLPPGPSETESPGKPSGKPAGPSSMRKWIARKIAEWTSKGKSSREQASGQGGRQAGAAGQGGGAAGSSMFSAIRKWAQGVLAQQQAAEQNYLEAQRDKEIQRLMDMLERDPDAGLKYALPMGPGSNDERRSRRSGGELTENDSNFDRRRLDAQGESDPWVVPWQTHAKLQQRYRELAQREIRLGRHRRAAYIYAHLLKDFENAALALKAGRHFHDAAMLYLEKLRRPVVAAECFRDGGFWEEALQIFVNHSLWLQAADLAARLGRHSDATVYVQKRIDELVGNKMYELAGQLADERLNDPQLAASLWYQGWTSSAATGRQCFEKLIAMHARRGSHVEAAHGLELFVRGAMHDQVLVGTALSVCSQTASIYPHQHVTDLARQLSWQLAELSLSSGDVSSRAAVLKDVRQLARFDRLLDRDTQRFEALANRRTAEANSTPAQFSNARKLSLVSSFQPYASHFAIPEARNVRWRQVLTNHHYFFALGSNSDGDQVLIRKSLESLRDADPALVSVNVFRSDQRSLDQCVLRASPRHPDRVWLHLPGAGNGWNPESIRTVAGGQQFFRMLSTASEFVLDFCQANSGSVFAVTLTPMNIISLSVFDDEGLEKESVHLLLSEEVLPDLSTVRIVERMDQLFLFAGLHVLPVEIDDCATLEISCVPGREVIAGFMLPSPAREIVAPAVYSSRCILICGEQGVVCFDTQFQQMHRFAEDFVAPRAGFTNQGIGVVACTLSRRIAAFNFNTSGRVPRLIGTIPELSGSSPIIGICSGSSAQHINIFTENGACHQFLVPPR